MIASRGAVVQVHVPILAWVLAAYLLVLAIVSVYLVCRLWPPSEQLNEDAELIRFIAHPVSVGRETHILLIVLAMGLVGGCAYDLWTLADNVVYLEATQPEYKARAFREVQTVWYALRPWTSCFICLIFYGIIRSGLMVANLGNGKDINVYGIAGLAGAADFFAGQTYDKLAAFLK
jgi:hypothetical protein